MLYLLGLVLASGAAVAQPVALVGATVIDGTGASPVPDAVIVVRGGRIDALGPRGEVQVPQGARRIGVHGKWIIPGLIDAHIHFFQSGGLYTRPDAIDLREVRPYGEERQRIRDRLPQTLARYIASGITAVADLGGPMWNFEVRELAASLDVAPHVAVAGPLLANYVPLELVGPDPPILLSTNAERVQRQIASQFEHAPDFIKLWLIPRAGAAPGRADWVHAAVDAASEAGVPVVAHATRYDIARDAVQAGAGVLAHSIDDRLVDAPLLEMLREREVIYITTLVVMEGYARVLSGEAQPLDHELRFGDPEVIATWGEAPHRAPRVAWGEDERREIMYENLRRVHAAGITIAAGSDAGNIGTLHGPGLHLELERMVEAGLTEAEVIAAATRGGARLMGREHEIGTLEPGKQADLVVLGGDPLRDIRHTRQIEWVMKGGRLLDPQEILSVIDREQER
jgi:imidazolonepropionase-like amidohydrolase